MNEPSSDQTQADKTSGGSCSTSGCPSCGVGKFLLIILAGLVVAYWFANRPTLPPATPSAVNWATDYDRGMAAAAEKQQPALLVFKATWCGPCRTMENEVFAKPAAAKALTGWVPIHVDVDQNRKLASKYEISGVPTLVVLAPDGKEIVRAAGAMSLEEFGQFLASAEARLNPPASSTPQT